ncbi:MAG TPA: lysine transporter LysE [Rheinheimera sp.]|jgi:L-lysine exporter family protein LysE/ArgO|nr:lysine transporter LysE [Rheinheimera sp.]|tara:strand:+ start:146 stop:778 length:633 start_codon:yes stop_codon:yes gene_type:complete
MQDVHHSSGAKVESFVSGLLLGLSLIIAIGAQNIWVLSQSMAGANRLAIALSCMLCDALLIMLGVYAATEVAQLLPDLMPYLTYGGVAMLLYLAFAAAKRAVNGSSGLNTQQVIKRSWQATALQAVAISLLNPHVYLDTVVLLGSIGAVQKTPVMFALGACLGSVLWFGSLTAFAPGLRRLLSSARRWRAFDATIAAILALMAWQLITLA